MDYVMKLVTTALEWSYAAGETDVSAERLQAAAELLTLHRNAIRMIDGTGPAVEGRPPEQEQQGMPQAEPGVEPASAPPKRGRRKKRSETGVQDGETREHAPRNVESETSKVLFETLRHMSVDVFGQSS